MSPPKLKSCASDRTNKARAPLFATVSNMFSNSPSISRPNRFCGGLFNETTAKAFSTVILSWLMAISFVSYSRVAVGPSGRSCTGVAGIGAERRPLLVEETNDLFVDDLSMGKIGGVSCSFDKRQLRSRDSGCQTLAFLRRNDVVIPSVNDQSRDTDGRHLVGNVISGGQCVNALLEVRGLYGRPLFLPCCGPGPTVADQRVLNGIGDLVRQAAVDPPMHHLREPLDGERVVEAGLGINEDERGHALRIRQRTTQRQESSLRHADQNCAFDSKVVKDGYEIVGRVIICKWSKLSARGTAMSALVPGDAPETTAQQGDLWPEHLVIHEQPVREYESRSSSAAVFVENVLAVSCQLGHCGTSVLLLFPATARGRMLTIQARRSRASHPDHGSPARPAGRESRRARSSNRRVSFLCRKPPAKRRIHRA